MKMRSLVTNKEVARHIVEGMSNYTATTLGRLDGGPIMDRRLELACRSYMSGYLDNKEIRTVLLPTEPEPWGFFSGKWDQEQLDSILDLIRKGSVNVTEEVIRETEKSLDELIQKEFTTMYPTEREEVLLKIGAVLTVIWGIDVLFHFVNLQTLRNHSL